MIIQNGTIQFKTQTAGTIAPDTGYRSQPSEASWGDPVPCNIQVVKRNLQAKASVGGEHFTDTSYNVYVEEDTDIASERVRLRDITGKDLGEFSVSQIEPLEAVGMVELTV